MIDEAVAQMLEDKNIKITNLVADIETIEEFEDPNEVKWLWIQRECYILVVSQFQQKKGVDGGSYEKSRVCGNPILREEFFTGILWFRAIPLGDKLNRPICAIIRAGMEVDVPQFWAKRILRN